VLGGDENVVTLLLATFSIGIGAGISALLGVLADLQGLRTAVVAIAVIEVAACGLALLVPRTACRGPRDRGDRRGRRHPPRGRARPRHIDHLLVFILQLVKLVVNPVLGQKLLVAVRCR